MKTRPGVTILVTVYNRAAYLQDCLESALASTYSDFELIVVDDASTDESVSVARRFEEHDERVKVVVNDRNLGQFANRNRAASLARGKYLKYLDSDDMLYPHGLETMFRYIDDVPEAGAAISHDQLHEDRAYPIVLGPAESYRRFFLGRGFPNSGPSAAIIRRAAFEAIGGFPEPHYMSTDTVFWLRLAARFPVVKIPPALHWYRRHADQAFSEGLTDWGYMAEDFVRKAEVLRCPECPLPPAERETALRELERRSVRKLFREMLRQVAPGEALRIWRRWRLPPSALLDLFRGPLWTSIE